MFRYISILVLLTGMSSLLSAQEVLSLDQAVQAALVQNYGIQVARNEAQISANTAHPGAAGLLPTVSASAGGNYNNVATQVEFATPQIPSVDEKGVISTSLNAGVNLNYRVFDGLGNVYNFRVLKKSATLSQTQAEAIIEATIVQVANMYYTIVRLQQNQETLLETLDISRDRLGRARNRQEFGSGNKLAILNSEVDLNTDSANLYTAGINLANAKRNLNALIGQDVETDFSVSTEVAFSAPMSLDEFKTNAQANNVDLRLAEYNKQVSELNLNIARSTYYPTFDINAGYNFNRADNGPGSILLSQQNLGLAVGASLNVNLFTGNQRKVQVQNAMIQLQNAQLRINESQLNLDRDLSNAYYTYQNNLNLLRLEEQSLVSAEENFTRTEDAFKLGQASNLQFREAQLNVQRVKNRIDDLRYTAKLSEIELLRLGGMLLQP